VITAIELTETKKHGKQWRYSLVINFRQTYYVRVFLLYYIGAETIGEIWRVREEKRGLTSHNLGGEKAGTSP
jgi:hypothetical protein